MAGGYRRGHTWEASRVSLLTSAGPDGHVHVATFNDRGDGQTDEGPDGHWHAVRQLEVAAARGHGHLITSTRAEAEPATTRRRTAQGG